MITLPNYHILEVSFIGATDHAGSRVRIKSQRFHKSVTLDYDHRFNNTAEIAQNWLTKKGFNLIGKAENNNGYFLISDTFETLKK